MVDKKDPRDGLLEELPDEEDEKYSNPLAIRKKAMDYLARREYGRHELIRKLAKAGYLSPIVEQAVAQLGDDGLQDDARFTDSFIQSRVSQGKGPVRIRLDLRQRGIAASLVDDALLEQKEVWFELARKVRRRKFGDDFPKDFKERARQMRFLQYRGFEQSHIQSAVGGEDVD